MKYDDSHKSKATKRSKWQILVFSLQSLPIHY